MLFCKVPSKGDNEEKFVPNWFVPKKFVPNDIEFVAPWKAFVPPRVNTPGVPGVKGGLTEGGAVFGAGVADLGATAPAAVPADPPEDVPPVAAA